jgi:arsenite methyltransferase
LTGLGSAPAALTGTWLGPEAFFPMSPVLPGPDFPGGVRSGLEMYSTRLSAAEKRETMTVPAIRRPTDSQDEIRHYYSQVLSSSADLKTGACCAPEELPPGVRKLVSQVHPEVRERFYGCGVPIPPALEGATVLDLGCGAGRDAYVLSQLVGEEGRVIGVDMTPEQLEAAERHRQWHAESFGHARSNVEFRRGYMEDLADVGIHDDSVDVVVSNCVFNLSPDKPRLFQEIFRVLKPGGELHFSDVFADRRIPPDLKRDPVLVGECLAGALYTEDFRRILAGAGCADVRRLSSRPVPLLDPEIEERIGMVAFSSVTVRAFKLKLEDRCEDYGQVATYLGTVDGRPHVFDLDDHHRFEAGRPVRVCGNTALMLTDSRYGAHFRVQGDRSVHFGLFDCGPEAGGGSSGNEAAAPCC